MRVAIYRQPDSVAVGGAISDTTGQFSIMDVKTGAYNLRTFLVGYKSVSTSMLVVGNQLLDLGTLLLEGDSKLLNEMNHW